jgi:hypothetical protein
MFRRLDSKAVSTSWSACSLLLGFCTLLGCGDSGKAILPEGNLTPEQVEKLKAEDAAVDEAESQGKQPKPKAKGKK